MDQLSTFPATLTLIAVNVLVSIYGWLNQQFLLKNLFDVGAIREQREYHRLLTSGFLHGGVFHNGSPVVPIAHEPRESRHRARQLSRP